VNSPFRGWKITLFEGGIHVPFFRQMACAYSGGHAGGWSCASSICLPRRRPLAERSCPRTGLSMVSTWYPLRPARQRVCRTGPCFGAAVRPSPRWLMAGGWTWVIHQGAT